MARQSRFTVEVVLVPSCIVQITSMESLWCITVPNRDGVESKSTYLSISRGLNSADSSLFTDLAQAEVPELSHGTLDSLVSLSDELEKTNIQVEVSTRPPDFVLDERDGLAYFSPSSLDGSLPRLPSLTRFSSFCSSLPYFVGCYCK